MGGQAHHKEGERGHGDGQGSIAAAQRAGRPGIECGTIVKEGLGVGVGHDQRSGAERDSGGCLPVAAVHGAPRVSEDPLLVGEDVGSEPLQGNRGFLRIGFLRCREAGGENPSQQEAGRVGA